MKLEGKRVWVTGSSGAIGSAIAKRFREEGAKVATDRVELKSQVAINKFAESFQPDVLVNCAGVMGPIEPAVFASAILWLHTLDVNLLAPFLLIKAVVPEMLKKGKGKIIFFSGGGAKPWPYHSAYSVSKIGLTAFVEAVAEEIAPMNIQINTIAPGPVKSKMNPEVKNTPDTAVELALFLASEESGDLTGRLISAIHDDWRNISNLTEGAGKLRRVPFGGSL
jgi:2-dehydro-3-deoxy-L-rhamnonate dehydrogenase (NAD+)